jgi:prepilin-type N-terminal cleavage/methylation domain-containing protein
MKNHTNYIKRVGFSLIELVIVIAIICLLVSMLVPAVNKSNRSIKFTQSKLRIAQIANGLKSYYAEYGCWPDVFKPNVPYSFIDKSEVFAMMLVGNSNYMDNFQQKNLLYLNPKRLKFMDLNSSDLYKLGMDLQKDKLADKFNNPDIYAIFADPNETLVKISKSAFDGYSSIKDQIPTDGLSESVVVFSYFNGRNEYSDVRKDAMDVFSWD